MKKMVSLLIAALLLALCLQGAAAEGKQITFGSLEWGASMEHVAQWAEERGIVLDEWSSSYSVMYPEMVSVLGMRVYGMDISFGDNGLEEVAVRGYYPVMRQTMTSDTTLLDEGALAHALETMLSQYGAPVAMIVEAQRYYRVPEEEYPYILRDMLRLGERMESTVYLRVYFDNLYFTIQCGIPEAGTLYSVMSEYDLFYYAHMDLEDMMDGSTDVSKLLTFPILNGVWQYRELITD